MERTRRLQSLLQAGVLSVDVGEKVDFTISFDDRRAVGNEHGNRLVEAQGARFAGTHGTLDAIFAPCRVIALHELGEFHRLFDTDASVAEIASRPREQSRG